MREIEFRAWIKRKNELLYLKGFRYSGNEKIKITFADEDADDRTYTFLKNEVILEQFTGLYDKNGAKIYEGDIVSFVNIGFGNRKVFAEVKMNDGCFDVVNDVFRDYLKCHVVNKSVEVIGNIHERSENMQDKENE